LVSLYRHNGSRFDAPPVGLGFGMIGLTVIAFFLKLAHLGDQLEYEKESIDNATNYGERKNIRFPENDRKPTVLNENPSIQLLKI